MKPKVKKVIPKKDEDIEREERHGIFHRRSCKDNEKIRHKKIR